QLEPEGVLHSELLWQCSTCWACVPRCPMDVRPPELFSALRAKALEEGTVPEGFAKTLFDSLTNVHRYGNPWGYPGSARTEWAAGLEIKGASDHAELLYYVGCSPSYDPRVQGVPQALVKIFKKSGLDFGFLGEEERCCGDAVRWLGEEGLFLVLAEENAAKFNGCNPQRIVTTSPHCYNIFKKDYPELEGEVLHYTQLLAELIGKGRLPLAKGPEMRVTYHDPCYLGRKSGIYEEPRSVLGSLPGVELVEMPRNRERSLCCGGGGGRFWLGVEQEGERLAELRLKEALETGAELMVTACPFCLINFREAAKTLNLEDKIRVVDLAELVSERLD
ncbi:MAG: (Fe-S)-binding protein, partial [Candidatus Bipolaricaulia bacterium]